MVPINLHIAASNVRLPSTLDGNRVPASSHDRDGIGRVDNPVRRRTSYVRIALRASQLMILICGQHVVDFDEFEHLVGEESAHLVGEERAAAE
jgi:hypothetical protein